jgi:hypothetical protein
VFCGDRVAHFDPARSRAELETLLAAARPDGFIGHTSFWKHSLSGARVAVFRSRVVGFGPTLRLLGRGDAWWLVLGVVLEAVSYLGGIALFQGVFATPEKRPDRLEDQLPDHDGRGRRHEGTGGSRGRRDRAHGLGAARLRLAEPTSQTGSFATRSAPTGSAWRRRRGDGVWLACSPVPAPVGVTLVLFRHSRDRDRAVDAVRGGTGPEVPAAAGGAVKRTSG